MTLHIDSLITHGEIDNSQYGHTIVRIWLIGSSLPIILTLEGNCWRDIAGSVLTFINPNPQPQECCIGTKQAGKVGDITASRKMRVPTVPEKEWQSYFDRREPLPTVWKNSLYLEWFNEGNERIVIETTDFELHLGPYQWSMDKEQEEEQKMENLQSMRAFMAQIIQRRPVTKKSTCEFADEFEWEQRLQESDRITQAYSETMEKYLDDSDAKQKEAFVMGWDHSLDDPEEAYNNTSEWTEGIEVEVECESCDSYEPAHPVQIKSRDLFLQVIEWSSSMGNHPEAKNLIDPLLQISSRLGAALEMESEDRYSHTNGYLLAVLKRCINWCKEAIFSCATLEKTLETRKQRFDLQEIANEIFSLRDDLTDIRRQYRPRK